MAIAYFSTWTTYGTWLPGDERGWYERVVGLREPDPILKQRAQLLMTEDALALDATQRQIVEGVIAEHCRIKNWTLHAVNCRSNHVHVAVSADEVPITRPREQFKMWGSRRLQGTMPDRVYWWTRRGWDVYVDDNQHLAAVVRYIVEGQD